MPSHFKNKIISNTYPDAGHSQHRSHIRTGITLILYLVTAPTPSPTVHPMAGQKPYKPNDPPQQPHFRLPKETDAMPDTAKSPNPTRPTGQQSQPPQNPNRPAGQGNLQNILAYFASQGVADDHVIATIGGFPLRLNELKSPGQPELTGQPHPHPEPAHNKSEERKRPSSPKTEEPKTEEDGS